MADFKLRFSKGVIGAVVPIRGGFTTTVEVSGPPTVTRQLLAANPLLKLETFTVNGEGGRTTGESEHGCDLRIVLDRANLSGVLAGQSFDYEVVRSMAGNFNGDKVLESVWGLGMAPRHYLLGSQGEYRLAKADADAQTEGKAVMIDAPVRLPERRVSVGDEWTAEWTGEARHPQTGAVFLYRQTALLQEVTEGPAARAHIAFKTVGTLQFPNEPSPQLEETVLETKGTVVLDLEGGLPVETESFGMMTTDLKKAGLKLVRGTSARYQLQ